MLEALAPHLPSAGIAGLLFVMWWYERQERLRQHAILQDAVRRAGHAADVNERLLDVIRANTEALTALRMELRSHRAAQNDWLERLSRRLDRLAP